MPAEVVALLNEWDNRPACPWDDPSDAWDETGGYVDAWADAEAEW